MGNMNAGGGYHSNGATERSPMSVFDQLPPAIREAIANAPYDYSTVDIARKCNEVGANRCLDLIECLLLVEVEQNALAAYGPDHPQAK